MILALWLIGCAGSDVDEGTAQPDSAESVDTEDTVEPPDPVEPLVLCDVDGDGVGVNGPGCLIQEPADCDDDDDRRRPGLEEICDGVDQDCSGAADEAWDRDGDGQAECAGDCDDDNPYNAEILPELCDGVDNDCDGDRDEGFDQDGDGVKTCRGDCDDADPAVHIGSPEVCDGADNDCDPTTDDNGDLDGDGISRCAGDCDDLTAEIYPGAPELCDQRDNDCDGQIESDPACFGCFPQNGLLMCTSAVDYATARAACAAGGGHLVDIGDANKNNLVATVSSPWGSAWIGLTDEAFEGTWVWEGGTRFVFTQWWAGEPNNSGNEDCIGTNFGANGYWNDYQCSTQLPFVCE